VPNGTKVTRVSAGSRPFTEEFLFDTTTGVVRTTRTMPDGSTATNTRNIPATPGTETTYTINPTDGTYGTQTRLVLNSTAPAKMVVTVWSGHTRDYARNGHRSVRPTGGHHAHGGSDAYDGRDRNFRLRRRRPRALTLPSAPATNPMRPFAVSASLDSSLRAVLATQVAGAPNLAAVNVAQLPADWRLWSSFAGVIVTVDDFAALDAARRAALRGWVGLGGQLFSSRARRAC